MREPSCRPRRAKKSARVPFLSVMALLVGCSAGGSGAIPPTTPEAALAAEVEASGECDFEKPACSLGESGVRVIAPSPWGKRLAHVRVAEDGSVWMAGNDGLVLRMERRPDGSRKIVKVRPDGWPRLVDVFALQKRAAPGRRSGFWDWASALGAGREPWIASSIGAHVRRDGQWRTISCGVCIGTWAEDDRGRPWVASRLGDDVGSLERVDLAQPSPHFDPSARLPEGETVQALASRGDRVWALSEGHATRGIFPQLFVSIGGQPFVETPLPAGVRFVDISFDPAGGPGVLIGHERRSTKLFDLDESGEVSSRAEMPGFHGHVVALDRGRVAMIAGANVFRVEGAEVTKLDPAPLDDDVFLSSEYYLDLHGLRPDDVWIVGEGGVVLHWDGKRLEAVHGQFGKSDFFREAAWWSRDEWVTLGNEGVLVRGRLGSSTISREPAPKLKYGHYRTLHTLASGEVLLSSSRDIVVRDAAEPWRRVLPPPDNIEQLAGASRRELWAVLEQSVDRDLKLWFFDGTSWELAPVAADGEDFVPRRMVALPERTLWGLGYRSQVVRVRGTRVDSPIASLRKQHPRDSFEAIAATNDRDVWLAGTAEDKSGLLVHWNGREAKRYAGLGPGGYEVLAVDPRGGVWASGLLGQATVVRDGRPASVDLGFSLNAMVVHPTGAWVGVASHGLIVERPAPP